MSISMKEIAGRADVDISTVSRVINGSAKISQSTREKVLKIINKLNYHPNVLAMRLRKQKAFTIGVCISGMGVEMFPADSFVNGVLQGIVKVFDADSGYDILLPAPSNKGNRHDYIRLIEQQKVDGVIVVLPESDDPGVKELEEEKGVAAVLVSAVSKKLDCVYIDNAGGTHKVVEHLVKLGHRRIGMIAVRSKEIDFRERYDAYRSALSKYGIEYIKELVTFIDLDYGGTAGYKGMKELLNYKPTAVFASDDTLAIGAMKAIQEAGLRIPEDIAIVGFDDQPIASTIVPSLTTVRQSVLELGREAANILIRRVEGKAKKQQKKIVPCELIVRASSGGKIVIK